MIQGKQFIFWKQFFNIFILSGISNTSVFKVGDVLHWVNFSVMIKPFPIFSVAPSVGEGNIWIYFTSHLFSVIGNKFFYIKSFFITITLKWCLCWYCWWWGFFSVFSGSWFHNTFIHSHHLCNRHKSRIIVLCATATLLKTC